MSSAAVEDELVVLGIDMTGFTRDIVVVVDVDRWTWFRVCSYFGTKL